MGIPRLPRALQPATLAPLAAAFVAAAVMTNGIRRMVGYAARYGTVTPDGTTYVTALERFGHGQSVYTSLQHAPYTLTDASWGAGFVYPPTALPVFLPLAWFGTDPWRLVNLVVLMAAAFAIVHYERRSLSVVSILATTAYVVINPFVWSAWTNAQVTPILVGLMGFGYAFPRWAGVLGTLGGLVKIYPVVMLAWALKFSGWKAIRDALLVGGVLFLASLLIVGSMWIDFAQAIRLGSPSCDVGLPDSIRCVVGEPYGQLVALGMGGLVSGFGVLLTSRQLAFACMCFGTMLASPDLNSAYWLLPSIGVLPAIARMVPRLPSSKPWGVLTRPLPLPAPGTTERPNRSVART